MKNKVFLFAVCVSAYFSKATTDAETVWLREMSTRLQTYKRAVTGPNLPDQLSFHLKRKSHTLTLNLKKNHQIDPNIDIYTVQKLKDGLPLLEKTQNLEMADVAYYQDRENGAFMTARCVKRSSGQCDIIITGNIRIGDVSFDLRPWQAAVTSVDFLEYTGLRGKRYALQEQANVQGGMSLENNGETNVNEKNVQEKLIDLLRRIRPGQDKHNLFRNQDIKFPNRNVLPRGEKIYGSANTKNDKTRNLKNYYVDVLVMADAGIWKLFLSTANTTSSTDRNTTAIINLREYFLHIINGVDLLYKGILDPSIRITVSIRAFAILQEDIHFSHIESKVEVFEGQTVIDGDKYFRDLKYWDLNIGSKEFPTYDQVILFTRHVMYAGTLANTDFDGLSLKASVCDVGLRVEIVFVTDYFRTTTTAAHELGHALGADHDGEGEAKACSSNDFFIMSTRARKSERRKKYTENPWLFSQCSVESFKRTLVKKTCVVNKHVHDQDILEEFNKVLRKQPGERYSTHEQCQIINGYGSKYCGVCTECGRKLELICQFMRCTDPETGDCEERYLSAATGTTCGYHKWCLKGLCVPIPPRVGVNTPLSRLSMATHR